MVDIRPDPVSSEPATETQTSRGPLETFYYNIEAYNIKTQQDYFFDSFTICFVHLIEFIKVVIKQISMLRWFITLAHKLN